MARTPVEEIKERLSILDVVGAYVELHKAGKSYKGKSPFTNEKTPSFFVSPDRGVYFCFSSQKGGDIFTFIQEMEGVDFRGALKILAEKAGVELVLEDPAARTERDAEFSLLEEAAQFFFREREKHPHVDAYIASRGVSGQTIYAWRIGYAPDEWRALKAHLTEKKYTEDQMLRAGLIKKTDPNKESYDVFRDRVMFPIRDASGRVVAFSGRTLKNEDGIPKYVNSPETDLFKKSEILYGYDVARQGIRHYDFSLVVEGQFDVVLSHQAGYTNTVAVSGTAFTPYHLALLMRLSNRVVLALDSDRAGVAAVKRTALLMLGHGLDVKVARMEGGKDPADIIKADPKQFKQFVGNAVHVVEFLLSVLRSESKDDRTYKLRVREELLPLLLAMPNRIDREHFESVIANAIGTRSDSIRYELERLSEAIARPLVSHDTAPTNPTRIENGRMPQLIEHLRAVALLSSGERPYLKLQIESEFEALGIDPGNEKNTEQRTLFIVEKHLESLSEKDLCKETGDLLTELSHICAKERLGRIGRELREAETSGDQALVDQLLEETKAAQTLFQKTIVISIPT